MQTIIKFGVQRPGIYTAPIYNNTLITENEFCPDLEISMMTRATEYKSGACYLLTK